MRFDLAHLPTDTATLHQIIAAQAAEGEARAAELAAAKAGLVAKALEVEKLKLQIARLRRMQFGRSSEKIARTIEQLELRLEELEAETPAASAETSSSPSFNAEQSSPAESASSPKGEKSKRRDLPAHLPCREVVHEPSCACPTCGGEMRKVGEDVTKVLDYIPGHFEVVKHIRPALSCRRCESMVQSPMPSLPIERGLPGPGLLAHILVSKYCDHQPLYRQSGIYARDGVDLDRAIMAAWVGKVTALAAPLVEAAANHVMAADKLHADDTPVPVLAPGTGKTKTGRLWVYLRDERPYGGRAPPAVVYRYSPDRKGEHPRAHLAHFHGFLQADGYSGFGPLYATAIGQPASVTEVACWAHVRRYFYDIHVASNAPIATEALQRIAQLFDVERAAMGRSPEQRRLLRQRLARPVIDDLAAFLDASLATISGRGDLAKAIRYARSRWIALTRYLDDGTLEISNNAAERAIRPLALGRKNYLFAGSDAGGERAAAAYTLIETAKLNELDPEVYLREVLGRIADHPINRIGNLLPWNIGIKSQARAAA
jgi:transposase